MNTKTAAGAEFNHLSEFLAGALAKDSVPGAVALVYRDGELKVEALGSMAADGGEPMQRDTIFRISSMTKLVAAAATLMLVDDGRIGLDEPVDRWLPELANRRVLTRLDGPLGETEPARRAITVRDLLTFRMGFGLIMAAPDAYPILKAAMELGVATGIPAPAQMPGPDEWIRRLGTLPLMHQPGEQWMYNTGSDVLGVLVGRVAGKSFEAFLQERLFGPLGMRDTGFSVPKEKIHRLPPNYWTNYMTGKFEVYDPGLGGQWSRPPAFESGGAGLVSTADDYFAFSKMLLDRGRGPGGQRILSEAAVAAMTSDQITADNKRASSQLMPGYFDSHGWGFGMAVVTKEISATEPLGQFGWDGGMGTSVRVDPKNGIIGMLLTQRTWTSPTPPEVFRRFWEWVYSA